jgi:hypothetical protein
VTPVTVMPLTAISVPSIEFVSSEPPAVGAYWTSMYVLPFVAL